MLIDVTAETVYAVTTVAGVQSRRAPHAALRSRLRDLANERRRFGYRRLIVLLRREGELSGINRIYRLYREDGVQSRHLVDRIEDESVWL